MNKILFKPRKKERKKERREEKREKKRQRKKRRTRSLVFISDEPATQTTTDRHNRKYDPNVKMT